EELLVSNDEPLVVAEAPKGNLPHGRINPRSSIPFFAIHLLPFLAVFTGITWTAVWLFMATYWGRMFFITAGYHRYFSHRAYRTSRPFAAVLAFGGCAAAQKGPLWWAGHHRMHHRYSDTPTDPHTPRKGFWWSHVGWILSDDTSPVPEGTMKEYSDIPEIRWIDKHDWVAPWSLAVACFLIGGWSGLLIGFFASTVLLWHSTFLVNSLAHVWGTRRFDTTDTSRNNFVIAVLTMGEGWHNNHHRYAHLARQGLYWWEVDASYWVLCGLEKLHIVWDLKRPRPEWLEAKPAQTEADLPVPD
ncbi:MAG: acyl-CoA desaturase, partial [Microthrixaceae bacterium]|nr:acyl-CoA desaturase [Microthrixaceae bacterium]